MKMQDKDLDEMFRSKLDDLEFKPSNDVWANINTGLEKDRRKKAYMLFLNIAAGIIILFTIGYLFIPQKIEVGGKTTVQAGLVKTLTVGKKIMSNSAVIASLPANNIVKPAVRIYTDNSAAAENPAAPGDSTENDNHVLEKNDEQLTLINTGKTAIVTPVLPVENTPIANFHAMELQTPQPKTEETIAQLPALNDKNAKPKHSTLSLGSLINAVVAKVDKRQDKIIEFTDDDGESSITGINLGIIKIKKDQQTSDK